ncbi:MAG TPA: urease accessory protein UreD [Lichenihabitans sp.]|nr:urease accessory protein UreD [Lichenihabitans sp.]
MLKIVPGGLDANANRARGEVRAAFARSGPRTEARRTFETGGYRLRMPRSHASGCDAVIVNTGGGMAGGDHVRIRATAGAESDVTLTTTAAEKIYRSDGATTRIEIDLAVEAGASLRWLPQETILFDEARLSRRLKVAMDGDASLLIGEILVFGRLAMGETMRHGLVEDRWRVRREGRLVFAEALRFEGAIADQLDRAALGAGARASATLLYVAPDAGDRLDAVRAALGSSEGLTAGASAWNGLLSVRALSRSPAHLRSAILPVLIVLHGRPLPRCWL